MPGSIKWHEIMTIVNVRGIYYSYLFYCEEKICNFIKVLLKSIQMPHTDIYTYRKNLCVLVKKAFFELYIYIITAISSHNMPTYSLRKLFTNIV